MPSGYWSAVWAVVWQSTVINSIVLTAAYWIRLPTSAYSIFMPFAAPVNLAALGFSAVLVGSAIGFFTGMFSDRLALWAATGGFAVVYGLYCLFWRANYQGDVTKGIDGFQFVLAIVAICLWWYRVIAPFAHRTS